MAVRFDPVVWRDRVISRYVTATSKDKCPSASKLLDDLMAVGMMQKLVEWAQVNNLDVVFAKIDAGGRYDSETNTITLSHSLRPINSVCTLLHEIGHTMVDATSSTVGGRYSKGWSQANDPIVKRTVQHRIDVLEEEFDAWAQGWKLAQLLDLQLDRKIFDRVRTSCLKSYVMWAAKDKRFKYTLEDSEKEVQDGEEAVPASQGHG